ncbi:hypothetical protein MMC07_006022 [Pseudocyphellaria aurata]|nr:hypothetical protein [Pseudocyphellaria aurata]
MSSAAGSSSEQDPPWMLTLAPVRSTITATSENSNMDYHQRRKALSSILTSCVQVRNYFEAIRDRSQGSQLYLVRPSVDLPEAVFRALSDIQGNTQSIERMEDLIDRLMTLAQEASQQIGILTMEELTGS